MAHPLSTSPPSKQMKLSLSISPPVNKISLASSLKPAILSSRPVAAAINGSFDAGGRPAAKKLVVKNARARPSASASAAASADFSTHALQTLIRAVRAILATPPEPTPESLQALYALCEGVIGHGHAAAGPSSAQQQQQHGSTSSRASTAQTLYDRVRIEVERAVGESAAQLRSADHEDAQAWLAHLLATWAAFTEKMLLVRSILLHLDRTYVLHNPNLLSLWDLGVDVFRNRLVEDAQIGARISKEILNLVNRERRGDAIDQALIANTIRLLATLSSATHTSLFASPFLASSSDFYRYESERLLQVPSDADAGESGIDTAAVEPAAATSKISATDVPAYLGQVRARLAEEGLRADTVVGREVKGPLIRCVEQAMVGAHICTLLDRGLASMLEAGLTEDLRSLYSLLGKVQGLKQLKDSFHAYLKTKGTSIVSDASRDDVMVDSLIALQTTSDKVLAASFSSDYELVKASRDAFVSFINVRQNKPAEMIAKFIDAKMRSGNKAMDDEELERTFRSVLTLFKYCQGKDIFEAFYKKDFAKRLLLNRSASSDAEKSMLLKLKEECGPAFTAKLETMAKDIDLSADIMKAYKDSLGPDIASVMSVNILTAGNWPTYKQQPVRIPVDLQKELERFTRFYKAKYAGRSLTWIHSLEHCTLRVDFDKGPGGGRKELNVSFHQAVILLLFDKISSNEHVTFKDIVEQTGLEKKEAARTLQSLACAKIKVLTKHPKGRDVNETDTFSFNASFRDDKYRLKINQIQQKETVEEQKSTTQQVLLDRQSHLQLVIVRILKSRKTIKHTALIMEVVDALKERFKVDPPEIKKAIDSLIDRDYMERNGRDAYNYLA